MIFQQLFHNIVLMFLLYAFLLRPLFSERRSLDKVVQKLEEIQDKIESMTRDRMNGGHRD